MRSYSRLKSWLFVVAVLLIAGAAVALAATRSTATTDTPLRKACTPSHRATPTAREASVTAALAKALHLPKVQ